MATKERSSTPLSNDQIRILTLLPAPPNADMAREPLRCTFRVASLSEQPSYEALSYVWGPPPGPDPKMISVGSSQPSQTECRQIAITDSLHVALMHIREISNHQPRDLWVDQLCINQDDPDEKGHQVDLMRQIYRGCSNCLVCLSPVTPSFMAENGFEARDMEAAMAWLVIQAALYRSKPVMSGDDPQLAQRLFTEVARTLAMDFKGPSSPQGALNALLAFFGRNNPWWSRIWTVQEVLLSPKATVLWGKFEILWAQTIYQASSGALEDSSETRDRIRQILLRDEIRALFETPERAREFEDAILLTMDSFNFTHLDINRYLVTKIAAFRLAKKETDSSLKQLRRWWHRSSTDPRDKVYALWGLIDSGSFPRVPKCDYTISAAELYTRITLDLLETHGLLAIVGRRGEPGLLTPENKELYGDPAPSWVFDNTSAHSLRWPSWIYRFPRTWFNFASDGRRVCEEEKAKPRVSDDQRVLSLNGAVFDKAVFVSDDIISETVSDPTSEEIRQTVAAWRYRMLVFATREGLKKYPAPNDNKHHHSTFWTNWLPSLTFDQSWRLAFTRTVVGDNIRGEAERRVRKDKDCENLEEFLVKGGMEYMERSISYMALQQAFFITKQGFIGMGPQNMQVGDEVAIVEGGKMPFLLRRLSRGSIPGTANISGGDVSGASPDKEAFFQFLGESYVDGIMHGEALRVVDLEKSLIHLV